MNARPEVPKLVRVAMVHCRTVLQGPPTWWGEREAVAHEAHGGLEVWGFDLPGRKVMVSLCNGVWRCSTRAWGWS